MTTFRTELRGGNISLSDPIREHVERRVLFALRKFPQRVDRVIVRLGDINGPKGGPDKRCRILATFPTSGSVIVEATHSDLYAAVTEAAARIEEKIGRLVTRRRSRAPGMRRGRPRRARDWSVFGREYEMLS